MLLRKASRRRRILSSVDPGAETKVAAAADIAAAAVAARAVALSARALGAHAKSSLENFASSSSAMKSSSDSCASSSPSTLPSTPSGPATQLGGRLRHARGVSSQVCEVRPIAPGVRLRECACTARPWRIVLSLLRCRAPVMVIQRP